MTDFKEFPDAEAVAAAWLRASALAEVGSRWYSSIPASPTWPLGVVKRIGGTPAVRRYLDAASLQVEVYGENQAQARRIAAAARVALHRLEGQTVSSPVAAFVSGVEDSLGLLRQTDPDTARDRYLFGVIVYLR